MIVNLVGNRIRAIRGERNLTQQQLAALAHVSRATLATIEKDDANPSLAVVHKIACALKVSIDELVIENHQRIRLLKQEDMRKVESEDQVYHSTVVSSANNHHFFQITFNLKANSCYQGKPHPPGSEEYLHILAGELLLEAGGEKMHLLAGDSASFGGNIHHCYINPTDRESRGMVTIIEPK
ncbi:MAG: helix-turn-helix domain-containing protein [Gammaproteobacteria bacterium]|nr:helix-turn-helix domain-containing protein [Gammaproteobacteria bacterium]